MKLDVTMLIAGLSISIVVLELLRRRALREKYAAIWLVTGGLTVVGAFAPGVVHKISSALGFEVASNFVFFSIIVLLLLVLMQVTLELGKVEGQIQTLAEEIALIRADLPKND